MGMPLEVKPAVIFPPFRVIENQKYSFYVHVLNSFAGHMHYKQFLNQEIDYTVSNSLS